MLRVKNPLHIRPRRSTFVTGVYMELKLSCSCGTTWFGMTRGNLLEWPETETADARGWTRIEFWFRTVGGGEFEESEKLGWGADLRVIYSHVHYSNAKLITSSFSGQ